MRISSSIRASRRSPLLQVAKSALATVAAWLLAGWVFPAQPPVFAAIAALLVVQPSLNQSLSKALERSAGVVAGVLVASALAIAFGSRTWVVVVAIVLAILVAWALRMTPGTANQVAISALLVIALGAATPDYAIERVLETFIGAFLGLAVNIAIVPPVALAPAREAVTALSREVATSLDRLAVALLDASSPAEREELLLTARLMRPMAERADASIDAGYDSLRLNPRGARHRSSLEELDRLLRRLTPVMTQTIGMTRAFYDRYDPTLHREPTVVAIAEQLRRAAHDTRRLTRAAILPAHPPLDAADADPALTTPLDVAAPARAHWILIGSLLEDLRRIHDELADPAPPITPAAPPGSV